MAGHSGVEEGSGADGGRSGSMSTPPPEGADVADPVVDRLRAELLRCAGLGDLLTVGAPAANEGRP